MKGKRIMITRYGFIELEGDMSDTEALKKVKEDQDVSTIDWGDVDFSSAEVVGDIEI